jgi:hypothetical protein
MVIAGRWGNRLASVRLRLALAAAGVVAVAVVAAALLFLAATERTLAGNVDAAAAQRAGEIVAALRGDDDPDLDDAIVPARGDRSLAQILDASGTVLASSSGAADRVPLTDLRPVDGQSESQQRTLPGAGEVPFHRRRRAAPWCGLSLAAAAAIGTSQPPSGARR